MQQTHSSNNGADPIVRKPLTLQLVEGRRKKARPADSATLMNHHIRRSIFRVTFLSQFRITRLQQVAIMFRVSERTILDALSMEVRQLVLKAA